jgi:integrase
MGKYAYATIESTMSALCAWHKAKDLKPAEHIRTQRVTQTLLNVRNVQGPAGLPVPKLGMSRPLLRLLLGYLAEQERHNSAMQDIHRRDAAWLLLGYFGMLRRSEIIALSMEDIAFLTTRNGTPPHLELTIRRSKTDRRGKGATIAFCATTNDNIQIFTTLMRWYELRQSGGANAQDPLFPTWERHSLTNTPIKDGQALAKRLKIHLSALQQRYHYLNVNVNSYGMHSLRRGGVQAAWQAGLDIERIKSHGRWRSDAVRAYMQPTLAIKLSVTKNM